MSVEETTLAASWHIVDPSLDDTHETFFNPLGYHYQDNCQTLTQNPGYWAILPRQSATPMPPSGPPVEAHSSLSLLNARSIENGVDSVTIQQSKNQSLSDCFPTIALASDAPPNVSSRLPQAELIGDLHLNSQTCNTDVSAEPNDNHLAEASCAAEAAGTGPLPLYQDRTIWQPPRRSANPPSYQQQSDPAPRMLNPIDEAICALWMTKHQCQMPEERTLSHLSYEFGTPSKILRQWFAQHALPTSYASSLRTAKQKGAGDIAYSLCTLWILKKSGKMPDDLVLASLGHAFNYTLKKLRQVFADLLYQDPVYDSTPVWGNIHTSRKVSQQKKAPVCASAVPNIYACTFNCGRTFAHKGM